MKSIFFILPLSLCIFACNPKYSTENQVVATNAWTAAYALAAGATDVTVLAPYEMVHPSEYELRAADIERLTKAKFIVYAGYEVMMEEVKTGLEIPAEKLVQITTSYHADQIENSVMMLAKKLGTENLAAGNCKEIRQLLEKGRAAVTNSKFAGQPALVHFFQESFASEINIIPTLVFGPSPPEPRQILEMAKSGAILVLDNAHNPVAGMMIEILDSCEYRLLLNFPGMYHTRTLADVIRYNTDQIIKP